MQVSNNYFLTYDIYLHKKVTYIFQIFASICRILFFVDIVISIIINLYIFFGLIPITIIIAISDIFRYKHNFSITYLLKDNTLTVFKTTINNKKNINKCLKLNENTQIKVLDNIEYNKDNNYLSYISNNYDIILKIDNYIIVCDKYMYALICKIIKKG